MKFYPKTTILIFYLLLGITILNLPKIYNYFWQSNGVINVYTYADFISTQSIENFQKETGIKVNVVVLSSFGETKEQIEERVINVVGPILEEEAGKRVSGWKFSGN